MKRHIAGLLLLVAAAPCLFAGGDLEKAVELRKAEQFRDAELLLKKYASPAQFDSLSPAEKIEFLRCALELAHIRALKDDVPGALALLNWAEGRPDPYQRAISCLKYAEILLDIGEMERASAYLKDADKIIAGQVKDSEAGAAIGQEGGSKTDTGSGWRDLRDEADVLKAEIESEALKKKYGASYGNYVKLRRMQVLLKRSKTPRYRKEALALADELMETDPASQFAAAAGYLKGEFLASGLEESSPKKEIKEAKDYLVKFVKRDPDGLYRGEALMLLGKISLEIEWNAKEAEKYYSQALSWFRKARERKDAMSLYAPMSDDLKKQTLPTQKPTTLNEWKRIVYHDEDPLKLYNTANAPVWYVDDKEKNCVYALGFLAFADGKYDVAKSYWSMLPALDSEFVTDDQFTPTVEYRLYYAVKNKEIIFRLVDKKSLDNERLRLMFNYIEFLIIIEKFQNAEQQTYKMIKMLEDDVESIVLFYCTLGFINDVEGYIIAKKKKAFEFYQKALSFKKASLTAVYGETIYWYAKSLATYGDMKFNGGHEALRYYKIYLNKYKDTASPLHYYEAWYMLAYINAQIGRIADAKAIVDKRGNFFTKQDKERLQSYIKQRKK